MKPKQTSLRLLVLTAACLFTLFASTLSAQSVVTLSMDTESGSNGAGVAWNPEKKVYYAVFAGNASFPLVAFSSTGKKLDEFSAGFDVRGFWYNPKTNQIEGNGYGDGGWYSISLDGKGMPGDANELLSGQHQPEAQAVGVLNPAKQTVIFYNEGEITTYSRSGKQGKTVELDLDFDEMEDLNYTSPIFTGAKGMEIGLLDVNTNRIFLFNMKSGKLGGSVDLPADAPTNAAFNFSYANGRVWIFDTDEREWLGYKVSF